MTAPVLQLRRPDGHGRQPISIERLRDLEDELTARKVGPREYQAATAIAARLRRYQAQNEEPEPDAPAVAA